MKTASFLLLLACCVPALAVEVSTARVPDSGLQPQAVVDDKGTVHLIYLKGDPGNSDVLYVRSTDAGKTWSKSIRVNSDPGAAVAVGTVRGAHLAVGPDRRPHVAWMGSQNAQPRGPDKATPMLYARLAKDEKSFEPQRNVLTERVGLDGGGSIAVDSKNRVYVGWHAPPAKGAGEAARAIWIAKSEDGGATFAKEYLFTIEPTGACACCGMRLFAAGESLFAIYRSAGEKVHRDLYVVSQAAPNATPVGQKVAPVTFPTCLMSTAAMTRSPKGNIVAAWETEKQVQWATIDGKTGKVDEASIHDAPGVSRAGRKHPSVAVNNAGQILLAWAEGTGWQKGGSVAWQVFDADGTPIKGASGSADKLPAWSLPAAIAAGWFVSRTLLDHNRS